MGWWMAAVLACGPGAVLSHRSAAALWDICPERSRRIDISIPAGRRATRPGITVHRRATLAAEVCHRIPVTAPVVTLVDIASSLSRDDMEAAINEADKLDLVTPDVLRAALDDLTPRPGSAIVRRILDRHTFVFTDSALERAFNLIARRAGLPRPLTRQRVNGFRVDFYWPHLGLVVETDGLRYHRTPTQQARDRLRDQTHLAAGLTPLRFTHGQIRHDPTRVEVTLRAVARRCR